MSIIVSFEEVFTIVGEVVTTDTIRFLSLIYQQTHSCFSSTLVMCSNATVRILMNHYLN